MWCFDHGFETEDLNTKLSLGDGCLASVSINYEIERNIALDHVLRMHVELEK